MDKIKRIQELVQLCNYHSNLYYNKDKPEISDKEYDQLYSELEALEHNTNYILSSSPTQKVQGKVIDSLQKVKHTEPMLSAEKSKDINDVIRFMGNQDCVLSWKLDGLTLVLKYDNGKFQQAITRGGGDYGEDVTHTVKTFINLPLIIPYDGYLEIRGEGLVTFRDFERINDELISKGEETYKSPRNLAAGSVRNLDSKIAKNRNMIFLAFGIIRCDKNLTQKDLQFAFLQELGFGVVEGMMTNKNDIAEQVKWFKNKVQYLDYLTDGLIIEYNDIVYGKAQGVTGHHSKSLYALKWQDDSNETVFKGVELNTTRTGIASITGLFKEVDIDGVKVARASLHNYDIFESLQLGIGDIVTVYRANAVIPQIEDNLTRSGTYKIDMHCPSCGSDLVIRQPKEARFLFCENENCPSKLINKFVHYCSKNALNIDGFSEAGIELFIAKGWLETFDDLYNLEQYKSEIIRLEGWGIRSYNKLIEAIDKSKNTELYRLLYGIGIPQIGLNGSKQLCKYFKNDVTKIMNANINELLQVEDFGEITARNVYSYFRNLDNIEMMNRLLGYLNVKTEEKKANSTLKDLTGLTFVVTGSVTTFKNRDEVGELITSLGGKLAGSVSKNTSYLLNNDVTSTSGKNQKAKELNVPIISEADFNLMIGRNI